MNYWFGDNGRGGPAGYEGIDDLLGILLDSTGAENALNPPVTIIAMFMTGSIDHSTAGSLMHEAAKTPPSPQLYLARAIDATMSAPIAKA
jgi:hypothetical protein